MRFWVLFFCLISSSIFAQSDSAIHNQSKWSAGVLLFPQFTDRTDLTPELFVPRFGYSAGLNIIYQITEKFSLESGILFTKKGWNFTFDNAPTDGSAWREGDCTRSVLRGGSWGDTPFDLRATTRLRSFAGTRTIVIGFRLVREL